MVKGTAPDRPASMKSHCSSEKVKVTPNANKYGNQRGSGLVEFALGLSVVVLAFVGLAQLGMSISLYNDLVAAVRAGARFAATADFDEPEHDFVHEVKNVVLFGNPHPAAGRRTGLRGLTEDNVQVSWERDAAGVPETITVALTGYKLPALLRTLRFTDRPAATFHYSGTWKPVLPAPAAASIP